MLGVGLAYAPHTPCASDAAACWEPIQSTATVLPELLVLYLLQLAAYVQMVVTERLLLWTLGAIEPPKVDTLIHRDAAANPNRRSCVHPSSSHRPRQTFSRASPTLAWQMGLRWYY